MCRSTSCHRYCQHARHKSQHFSSLCRLIVTTLIMEYILANAAVARAFSHYFATLIGQDPMFFTIPYQQYEVDFLAAGLVIACCVLLMFTTAGGSWFNIGERDCDPAVACNSCIAYR